MSALGPRFTTYRARVRDLAVVDVGARDGKARRSGLACDLELLNPAAPIGLRHIDAAPGIDCDGVAVREVADLVAGSAEARQDLATGMVERVHLLAAAVHHVHELLRAVGRERDPPGGAALIRKLAGRVGDQDVA